MSYVPKDRNFNTSWHFHNAYKTFTFRTMLMIFEVDYEIDFYKWNILNLPTLHTGIQNKFTLSTNEIIK